MSFPDVPARPAGDPGRPDHPIEVLSALLDGELDGDEAAEARAHLDGCAACRSELDELAGAREALRSLPSVEPPPAFVASLVAGRRRANRRATAVALVAASVAVVAGLFTAPTSGGGDDGGIPRPLALSAEGQREVLDRPGPATGLGTERQEPVNMTAANPRAIDLGDGGDATGEDDDEDDDSLLGRMGDAVSGLLEAIGG